MHILHIRQNLNKIKADFDAMKIDIKKELAEFRSFIRYSIEKLDIKTVLHTIQSSEDALCKGVERIKQRNGLVEARMS
jgi:16S rRNA C1402 N4-methylase RsmH